MRPTTRRTLEDPMRHPQRVTRDVRRRQLPTVPSHAVPPRECQSDPPSLPRAVRCSRPREQPTNRASPLDVLLHVRAYAGRAAASVAARADPKAIRPLASWRSARWFSSFFDQRIRIPRSLLSQLWLASTTQRRARQPGVRTLSAISSPRLRMCGVSSYSSTMPWTSALIGPIWIPDQHPGLVAVLRPLLGV